jgi:predicted dehydrogenase
MKKIFSRRVFLGSAAAGSALLAKACTYGPTVVSRPVLGGPNFISPNEKLRVACIGVGGKGRGEVHAMAGEHLVAFCDPDDEQAAETYKEFPDIPRYKDFRIMLEEKCDEIDAVTISTPDHVHGVAAMMAMRMGKHVFCQKPLTRTIYEARTLTEAARKYGVATQMGNQGHASEHTRRIKEWIHGGCIGKVREVHFYTNRPIWPQGELSRPGERPPVPETLEWDTWLGPAQKRPYHPCYLPFTWRGWWDYGTGALGDMGCHIMDAAFYALDLRYPTAVEAVSAPVNNESAPAWSVVTYEFPARGDMPPVRVKWFDGGKMMPWPKDLEPERSLPDGSGQIIIGDNGSIMAGTYGGSPRIIPEARMQEVDLPDPWIPRVGTIHEDWIQACKGGEPACSNFDYSGPLTEMVLLGNLAIRTGKRIQWHGERMKCLNVPEANDLVYPDLRRGWRLI